MLVFKSYNPLSAEDCFRTVFRRFSIFAIGKIENLLKTVLKQSSAACAITYKLAFAKILIHNIKDILTLYEKNNFLP